MLLPHPPNIILYLIFVGFWLMTRLLVKLFSAILDFLPNLEDPSVVLNAFGDVEEKVYLFPSSENSLMFNGIPFAPFAPETLT